MALAPTVLESYRFDLAFLLGSRSLEATVQQFNVLGRPTISRQKPLIHSAAR